VHIRLYACGCVCACVASLCGPVGVDLYTCMAKLYMQIYMDVDVCVCVCVCCVWRRCLCPDTCKLFFVVLLVRLYIYI